MFVVIETKSNRYYNGRASDWEGNLTNNLSEAFEYGSENEARLTMDRFNRFTSIHGLVFTIGAMEGLD